MKQSMIWYFKSLTGHSYHKNEWEDAHWSNGHHIHHVFFFFPPIQEKYSQRQGTVIDQYNEMRLQILGTSLLSTLSRRYSRTDDELSPRDIRKMHTMVRQNTIRGSDRVSQTSARESRHVVTDFDIQNVFNSERQSWSCECQEKRHWQSSPRRTW